VFFSVLLEELLNKEGVRLLDLYQVWVLDNPVLIIRKAAHAFGRLCNYTHANQRRTSLSFFLNTV